MNYLSRIATFQIDPTKKEIPDSYKQEFSSELISVNIKQEKILSTILISIIIVLYAIDAAVSDLWIRDIHIFSRISKLHHVLIAIPVLFLIVLFINDKSNKSNLNLLNLTHFALVTVVLSICALISAEYVNNDGHPYTYIISIFCISSLITLKCYESCTIYFLSYLIYVVDVVSNNSNILKQASNLIFIAMLTILALIVSRIRLQKFIRSFMDNKTILDKNVKLKELSTLLKAAFDNIPDIIIVKNDQNELIHGNKAACLFYGTSENDLSGSKCYEIKGEEKMCDDCYLKEVYETKKPIRIERYLEAFDIWHEIRSYPILDEFGNITKIIELIRDISFQKKTDIELERINSILQAQLEASPDGILIIDKDLRILGFNKRLVEIADITEDIIKTKDGKELFKHFLMKIDNNGDELIIPIDQLESEYKKVSMKNGTILDIYSAPVLLSKEEAYGVVWYLRDITERERMLAAIKRGAEENEKLLRETMKFDELKSEFFANISHEFRTPINVLLGILQLMNMMKTEKHESQVENKIKRYLSIMRQNCFRLLRLTNNLIDMTRLDTGFLEINLNNYNIVKVVEDITLSVASYVENKGISLIFDTDIEERIMAIDADKIERIMLNLLSNAVKFTKNEGTIIVNIHDKTDSVEISVKDTGIGIPEDKIGIIFERFRQVNSTLSRENEGSGIGLSLTKNLVELHGGTISVRSELNKGSEFIFELPCRTVAEGFDFKESVYNNQNHVERISIEFSDVYSVQNAS